MSGPIVIVTRGSPLALQQTHDAAARLQAALGRPTEIRILTTTGDRQASWSLEKQGGKGLFTAELEQALLRGEADLAIHSSKDLPTEMPAGLAIAVCLQRQDPRDVLVRRSEIASPKLIATGSPRRRAQGALAFPQAQWTELRGNVDTRLKKLANGDADASYLAASGLNRLGIKEWPGLSFEPVALTDMVPAAGQGGRRGEVGDGESEVAETEVSAEKVDTTRGVVAGKGGVAAFAELGEEQALDGHRIRRGGAAGGDILRDIGGAGLERDGALSSGGYHIGERDGFEGKAGPFLDAETIEAGSGEV